MLCVYTFILLYECYKQKIQYPEILRQFRFITSTEFTWLFISAPDVARKQP